MAEDGEYLKKLYREYGIQNGLEEWYFVWKLILIIDYY
jgi:hypothetical protein